MYYRLKNDIFRGFYESKEQEGTFVEITLEDWQEALNKQSEGEVIFYNPKSKKLETILLGQFEILNGTSIETDILALKKSIISELAKLKYEYSEKEFLFQGKYWQKNRETGDRNNLTSIMLMLTASKQLHYDGWKVVDKDSGKDVYLKLSIQELNLMALHMQEQVTKSMKTETALKEKLETLLDEELKLFNAREEFEKLWN